MQKYSRGKIYKIIAPDNTSYIGSTIDTLVSRFGCTTFYEKLNPEKTKIRKQKWREANPDKVKEQKKKWREANRDKINARKRELRALAK